MEQIMMIRRCVKLLTPTLMILLFPCVVVFITAKPVLADQSANGILVGQFNKNGNTPLADGRLFIYSKAMGPPSSDKYVRVPDQVAGLDKEGKFSLELPAGAYYLSAIKTPEDGLPGPPAEGEAVYFKMDSKGEIQAFIVTAGNKTNAGVISSSTPFKRKMNIYEDGVTMVEGIVVDADGSPVNGAIILVNLSLGVQNMAAYASERTGKDGKFALRFNDGGIYYLRVRGEFHGGTPTEGEIVNINDPKEQVAVNIKKGEKLTGVTIKVKRHHRGK